ncbi:MAG: hypothetical protein ACHP9Y_00255, partial [Gammaproteobacteria bacterium]
MRSIKTISEQKSPSITTPLQDLVIDGNINAMEYMFTSYRDHVNVHENLHGFTALHFAAFHATEENKSNYVRIIDLLIENGANINALSDTWESPADLATVPEVRERLQAKGAYSLGKRQYRSLEAAVRDNNPLQAVEFVTFTVPSFFRQMNIAEPDLTRMKLNFTLALACKIGGIHKNGVPRNFYNRPVYEDFIKKEEIKNAFDLIEPAHIKKLPVIAQVALLYVAIHTKNLKLLDKLLIAGVDCNNPRNSDKEHSVLFKALNEQFTQGVPLLVENNADFNSYDKLIMGFPLNLVFETAEDTFVGAIKFIIYNHRSKVDGGRDLVKALIISYGTKFKADLPSDELHDLARYASYYLNHNVIKIL